MITFGFKDYTVEMPNWSKHHQEIGVHVKRVYSDGKVVETDNETLLRLMKEHGNLLKEKAVILFSAEGSKTGTDFYLPLSNQQYKDGRLSYYSVGAMNTKQTTSVRYSFQLEEVSFKLDHTFKSAGSYASSFFDQIRYIEGSIEEVIQDILDKDLSEEDSLSEYGLAKGHDEDYQIVVVTEKLEITTIEVSKQELLKALVGIEIYAFEQEIV